MMNKTYDKRICITLYWRAGGFAFRYLPDLHDLIIDIQLSVLWSTKYEKANVTRIEYHFNQLFRTYRSNNDFFCFVPIIRKIYSETNFSPGGWGLQESKCYARWPYFPRDLPKISFLPKIDWKFRFLLFLGLGGIKYNNYR